MPFPSGLGVLSKIHIGLSKLRCVKKIEWINGKFYLILLIADLIFYVSVFFLKIKASDMMYQITFPIEK